MTSSKLTDEELIDELQWITDRMMDTSKYLKDGNPMEAYHWNRLGFDRIMALQNRVLDCEDDIHEKKDSN